MAFFIKKLRQFSFNTESGRVCYFPSQRGIFFTRVMYLIKVENSVTNRKSKSKRMTQVKVRHVYTLQNSNPLYFDSYTISSFPSRLQAKKKKFNNVGPMWRCSKENSEEGES